MKSLAIDDENASVETDNTAMFVKFRLFIITAKYFACSLSLGHVRAK
jgi:hypothetical protein